ncbi:MAG: hypothetical protein M3Z24_11385 [Chloroflexota bacterium]|nr:hypothetical protein [Chloroflexota bacterium]
MLGVLLQLHYFNLFLVLGASLIASIWGFILYFTTKTMNQSWRIALYVTAIAAALQGVFGILMLALGGKPSTGTGIYYLHYVYGAIALLSLPIAITYATAGKNPRRDVLIYSLAALIVFAAGFRGWMTGPVHWP